MTWRKHILFLCCLSLLSSLAFAVQTDSAKADPVLGKRRVKFINKCSFPVWFGMISGATDSNRGDNSCGSDADCKSGSVCVNRGAAPSHCFWKNPIPANGNYMLAPGGGSNNVYIPIYQNGLPDAWSGAATGRTNCVNGVCETGDCEGGDKGCPPGKGFTQPTTMAEFTFNNQNNDYYDIELVNGMNIPVEMKPILTAAEKANLKVADPYYCGNPGGSVPFTQVGSCKWNMVPPSNDYKHVAVGGAACTTDANCTAPAVCGLSYDPKKTPKLQKTCGKLLGYWSPLEACGKDKDSNVAPFFCKQALPAPYVNLTNFNMYGCAPVPPLDSCYKNGAPASCCGCANWDQAGLPVPPGPATKQCDNKNPYWVSNVQPKLQWAKKGCPTAYTYPFDDMSSTFQCRRDVNNLNVMEYVITFCPGGHNGGVTG